MATWQKHVSVFSKNYFRNNPDGDFKEMMQQASRTWKGKGKGRGKRGTFELQKCVQKKEQLRGMYFKKKKEYDDLQDDWDELNTELRDEQKKKLKYKRKYKKCKSQRKSAVKRVVSLMRDNNKCKKEKRKAIGRIGNLMTEGRKYRESAVGRIGSLMQENARLKNLRKPQLVKTVVRLNEELREEKRPELRKLTTSSASKLKKQTLIKKIVDMKEELGDIGEMKLEGSREYLPPLPPPRASARERYEQRLRARKEMEELKTPDVIRGKDPRMVSSNFLDALLSPAPFRPPRAPVAPDIPAYSGREDVGASVKYNRLMKGNSKNINAKVDKLVDTVGLQIDSGTDDRANVKAIMNLANLNNNERALYLEMIDGQGDIREALLNLFSKNKFRKMTDNDVRKLIRSTSDKLKKIVKRY